MAGDETINALRQALQFSPDNVPLRQHLAETLLAHNRPEEAEREFRQAIPLAPNVSELKVGLATPPVPKVGSRVPSGLNRATRNRAGPPR